MLHGWSTALLHDFIELFAIEYDREEMNLTFRLRLVFLCGQMKDKKSVQQNLLLERARYL
jgi:hypothetical protein